MQQHPAAVTQSLPYQSCLVCSFPTMDPMQLHISKYRMCNALPVGVIAGAKMGHIRSPHPPSLFLFISRTAEHPYYLSSFGLTCTFSRSSIINPGKLLSAFIATLIWINSSGSTENHPRLRSAIWEPSALPVVFIYSARRFVLLEFPLHPFSHFTLPPTFSHAKQVIHYYHYSIHSINRTTFFHHHLILRDAFHYPRRRLDLRLCCLCSEHR